MRFFLCAITPARNSLRCFEYASSVSRLSREICAIFTLCLLRRSQTVSEPHQRYRMRQDRLLAFQCLAGELCDALFDMVAGQLAVRADVVGFGPRHAPEDRLADLHRHRVELLLHTP